MSFYKRNKLYFTILGTYFISIFILSCKSDNPIVNHCDNFQWGYEGNSSPSYWGTCHVNCSGQVQSPVNIETTVIDNSLSALTTEYKSSLVKLLNNGHTVEFDYEEGSKLMLNGKEYQLLQFHFHTSSEHTVKGVKHPMEVHLVHKNTITGDLVVIAVLFKEGKEHPVLEKLNDNLPKVPNQEYHSTMQVNAKDLLPKVKSYYTYGGSLTTPPCSETVTWFLFKTPSEASGTQIQNIHSILKDNYRPLQPLNNRTIREYN